MTKPLILALATTLALSACSKDSREEQPASSDPTPATQPKQPAAEPAAEPGPSIDGIMQAYEACRARLAADDADVAECAGALASAAQTAENEAIASAATALAATAGQDIAKVRLAFGKVSEPVVALVSGDGAGRYHVFECPMAEGYQRWVQPNTDLENPYMGQKMLACGSQVDPQATP